MKRRGFLQVLAFLAAGSFLPRSSKPEDLFLFRAKRKYGLVTTRTPGAYDLIVFLDGRRVYPHEAHDIEGRVMLRVTDPETRCYVWPWEYKIVRGRVAIFPRGEEPYTKYSYSLTRRPV